MAINNFPTSLQPAIQTGFLQHQFEDALQSKLAFRAGAGVETFQNRVGETITKTRPGLKAPKTTPIVGSSNTNLDNGLTPAAYAVEQYTLTLGLYADTIDLNLVTEKVGIANQFVRNAVTNGLQAGQTLERLAAGAFYTGAIAGKTYVTLTSTLSSVHVNDVTGFQYVFVNGVLTPVSGTNPLTIVMGPSGNTYSVTAVAVDGSNVSTARDQNGVITGKSGTLTLSSAAQTGDAVFTGTFPAGYGTSVTAATATSVVYANNRANASYLASGDLLTQKQILSGVAQLRNNAIPTMDNGTYGLYLSPTSMLELYSDADFKLQFSTRGEADPVYKNAIIDRYLGVTFFSTNEAPSYTLNGNTVWSPILAGKDALIEARFENMADIDGVSSDDEVFDANGAVMVTRSPIDRLRQIVAQSWYSIVAFTVPTDVTANNTIIPTASNAAIKRIVMLQHT